MILDAETLEPAAAVDALVAGAEELDLPGRLKTELHASIVELNTGVCADVDDAVAALRELRRGGGGGAAANGAAGAGAGPPPTAPGGPAPLGPGGGRLPLLEGGVGGAPG